MKQLTDRQFKLAQAVQAHAVANYETGGWDVLVECYTLEEVAGLIGKARTELGAIWAVAKRLQVYVEARKERQAEADHETRAEVQPEPTTKPEGFKVEGVVYGVNEHSGDYHVRFPGFVGKLYVDDQGAEYTPGWRGVFIDASYCSGDNPPF